MNRPTRALLPALAAALILGWFARMVTLARIIHTEVHDYGV